MLLIDITVLKPRKTVNLCLFYGAISGDDYIFSDNSDPKKRNSRIFPQMFPQAK